METLFIGRNFFRLEETASTNNYAAGLLRNGNVLEGTLITTDLQSQGKGQRGKSWFSEQGKNMTCSIVLLPSFLQISQQYLLNKAVALGVYSTVKYFLRKENIFIKWPNDILVNNKKLAGILIENAVSGSQIVSCVAGIGLNVNQERFPESLPDAVSLILETGKAIELELVELVLCKQIEIYYLMLKSGKGKEITERYNDALWRKEEFSKFKVEGNSMQGRVIEVDEVGRLVVEMDGKFKSFYHGDIGFE